MTTRPPGYPLAALALLLAAASAGAQSLDGLWGSALYRVQLSVSGTTVTGSFAPLEGPQATSGTLSGQLQPGGRAFTAEWRFTSGGDTGSFKTWLSLGKSGVLSGYRWSAEAQPTSFALHRAVNGQLVQLIDQSTMTGGAATAPTGGGATGGTGAAGGNAASSDPRLDVITCESVTEGNPQNPGSEFTAPKTIATLVRYRELPAGSTVDWVWNREGRTEAKLSKVLTGSGWHMHALRSDTAIIPGTYQVTVSLNGSAIAQRNIVVRAAGGGATSATGGGATPAGGGTAGANTAAPGIEVIMCQGAPGGEPRKPGTTFTKPRQLVCLIKHRNLPANSEVKWVWQRPGGPTTYSRRVSGTGWTTHGLASPDAPLTPGTYSVTVYACGSEVTTVTATVK